MIKFGLTAEEYEQLQSIVVRPLSARGAKVWCFGSRAVGSYSKFSDLDIMVEANQDVSELVAEVRESIIDSSFPYKVDIVELKNFAKDYRDNFESEKILLTERSH